MVSLIKKHRFFVLLSVLFILLRLPSLFEPYWYGDEGIYLTLGQAINHGVVLFRQIHDNKPPSLYYLAAFAQTVFGFRLLLSLFMIPSIYFFYKISKEFLSIKSSQIATLIFLILTSTPLFEGNIANAEIFMIFPTLLGVYLYLVKKSYLYTGLLLGLAFTIKVPVAVELLFLVIWVFFIQKPFKILPPLKLGIGFTIPIVLWSIYFIFQNAFSEFLFASLLQNFGYLSSWSTGSHSGSATQGGLVTRLIFLLIYWLVVYLLYRKKILNQKITFVLGWFAATVFGALLSSRPYPHYLIQLLPPLSLLLVQINLPIIITILVTIFLIIFKYKFYFYPVFGYYQNFYQYALHQKSQNDYRRFFGWGVNDVYQIAEFIKTNSTSSDRIFIWGDEPYIYPLSNRLPVSKYTVAYHVADFNQYRQTFESIKTSLPKFIVYYSQPNRPFSDLDQFIAKFYHLRQTVGQGLIYEINQ
ncbi:MAG TPA: hypothetical protein PK639_04460 [Candidatus Woesebacteria bacterium]|nr:hypothetical protein [Candidatus Woesebacteria bacterium]